ncbi:hypothetical protein GIB94_05940, partial [Listeria monocytogenes]|nr:hypothetical protein [Listeria monocytogenes]
MELKDFHQSLIQQVNEDRQLTGSTFEEAFFDAYADYLVENDEIIGEPNFLHFEMPLSRNQKACISGFAYNELDGILYLMLVDDIDFTDEIPTLLLTDAERLYKRARNFFSHSEEIAKYGEESNEAVNLARSIYTRKENDRNQYYELASVKVFIFTDKPLTRTLKRMEDEQIQGVKISTQLVGIERILSLSESRKGKVDLEINLNDFQLIPALKANEADDYESYLCNINGYTLAKLYNEYGSRLIESNVRSFLQTRGNVNKGIKRTILKEPER